MTDPDYREAIRITGKNEIDLINWAQDMQPDFIVNRSDDAVQIVYTDGDGGLMLFTGICEIFDDCGIKIETINAYCDIADEDFMTVLNLIREPLENNKMHSRDHSWLHGDEHLNDSDKVEQLQKQYAKEARQDFFMLANDLAANLKFLESDINFVPDADDIEMLADLNDQLSQSVARRF